MTDEEEFQKDIVTVAKVWKWKVFHPRKVRTVTTGGRVRHLTATQGDIGYVDLSLARNGVRRFVEVKTCTGRLSPEQKDWQIALGDEHRVWRPQDWEDIVHFLSDGRGVAAPHWQWLRHLERLKSKKRKGA